MQLARRSEGREGKRHALVKTHAARSLPAYSAEQPHLFLILRNWHAA
jgi:hypothetical protein